MTAPEAVAGKTTEHFAVPVLMYHRVNTLTPAEERSPLIRDLTVSPQDFEAQIRTLKDQGFTFLLASEVEEAVQHGRPLPEKAIAITLDDGYKDNFDIALPILRKHNVPATVFVVTDSIGKPQRLSWAHISLMHGNGVAFGSHTVHHYDLTTLKEVDLDYELRESKRVLELKLEEPVDDIAYPSGKYDARVVERARIAGYTAGWKKGGGPVRPGDDLLMLPRIRVHGKTTMSDFKRKFMSGIYTVAMEKHRRRASDS